MVEASEANRKIRRNLVSIARCIDDEALNGVITVHHAGSTWMLDALACRAVVPSAAARQIFFFFFAGRFCTVVNGIANNSGCVAKRESAA